MDGSLDSVAMRCGATPKVTSTFSNTFVRSVRLAIGVIEPDDVNTRHRRGELEKTLSRRWADLLISGCRKRSNRGKEEGPHLCGPSVVELPGVEPAASTC
jgi:hypothetical protein